MGPIRIAASKGHSAQINIASHPGTCRERALAVAWPNGDIDEMSHAKYIIAIK